MSRHRRFGVRPTDAYHPEADRQGQDPGRGDLSDKVCVPASTPEDLVSMTDQINAPFKPIPDQHGSESDHHQSTYR